MDPLQFWDNKILSSYLSVACFFFIHGKIRSLLSFLMLNYIVLNHIYLGLHFHLHLVLREWCVRYVKCLSNILVKEGLVLLSRVILSLCFDLCDILWIYFFLLRYFHVYFIVLLKVSNSQSPKHAANVQVLSQFK